MTDLLRLNNISVHFSGLKALTDVSFSASPGQVKALIGPNGAGKTTLFNVISGYVPPTSGEVYFNGEEIQGLTPHEISARGVRRTFQNGGLFGEMTVLENILTGMHVQINSHFMGLLFGTRKADEEEKAAAARAMRLLALMDMSEFADQQVKSLSGGQQRMVEIIRTISTEPPLLLLDEPAVGLSPPMRIRMMEVIKRLAGEEGISILLIEHAIDLVMAGSDRIVVLCAGQNIAEGKPAEIRENREVLEAYLGYA
ncbi:MAG: ABC transporter ATP-binding protein [Rhodospirillales bacterium]|nr:ABC transporter ATP-binding protein [Rhodospirillales bacterium]